MEGTYYQLGGSIGTPTNSILSFVGVDSLIMPQPGSSTTYYGISGNVGIGTPGAELHAGWGNTRTVEYCNIFNLARRVYKKIMEW